MHVCLRTPSKQLGAPALRAEATRLPPGPAFLGGAVDALEEFFEQQKASAEEEPELPRRKTLPAPETQQAASSVEWHDYNAPENQPPAGDSMGELEV